MADSTNSGAQVSCQTAKYTYPTQSTLGKIHELDSEYLQTQPSKEKNNLGSELVEKEGRNNMKSPGCVNELWQSFSSDVTKEILSGPPEVVITNNQCTSNVIPITSELKQESGSVSSCNKVCVNSENLIENSLAEQLELPPEEGNRNSHTGNSRCPQSRIQEQIHESSSQKPHNNFEPARNHRSETNCLVDEQLEPISENMTANFINYQLVPPSSDVSRTSHLRGRSGTQRDILEGKHEIGCGGVLGMSSVQNHDFGAKVSQKNTTESSNAGSNDMAIGKSGPPFEIMADGSDNEKFECHSEDATGGPNEQVKPPAKEVSQNSSLKMKTPHKKVDKNSRRLAQRDKKNFKNRKNKYMLRSLVQSDRLLRSRMREKAKVPEQSSSLHNIRKETEKRGRKKEKRGNGKIVDEFSRIRRHLGYLVNRMKYEQSLIDAYSGEGWKGYSSEKLKPEKELQRATSEILRRKLKIRDLFRLLDSICGEGRLPECLFDSAGEIDSEDIFCAKCGSKEVAASNDIILCDGACDRGFHQFCLEPPLLNEDIPTDDDGWLCPACDCKFECIDLLNDIQGTNLSITDSWEKVYPEAAAGKNQDDTCGIPSDDSDDNDYDPDGPETDEEGDESSSDESEYAASNEMETRPTDDQCLGLPSDDSEDDDYDPTAPDLDEKVNKNSSSSDFTSDSEDLAAFDGNDALVSSSLNGTKPPRGSIGGRKKCLLNDELHSLTESEPGQDGFIPISVKRQVERLDYKKLHDEEYGNSSSDSSDDEDWNDTKTPESKKSSGKVAAGPRTRIAAFIKSGIDMRHDAKETEQNATGRSHQKLNIEEINNNSTKSSSKRLGEAVIQKLFASFEVNQYPDRATKESLAQDLGISFKQVSKWFENTRWHTRHPSGVEANKGESTSEKSTPLTLKGATQESSTPKSRKRKGTSDLDVRIEEIQKTPTQKSRKQKGTSNLDARIEETEKTPNESPKVQVQTGSKIKTR